MALWKPYRGNRADLATVEKHDGYIYFCVDDGSLFFDYTDAAGNLQRKQINAKDAETLGAHTADEFLLEADIDTILAQAKESGEFDGPQSDWTQTDSEASDYIKNKPTKLSQFENDKEYIDKSGGTLNTEANFTINETLYYRESAGFDPDTGEEIFDEFEIGNDTLVLDKDKLQFTSTEFGYPLNDYANSLSTVKYGSGGITATSSRSAPASYDVSNSLNINAYRINMNKLNDGEPGGDTLITPRHIVLSALPDEGDDPYALGDTLTIDPSTGISFECDILTDDGFIDRKITTITPQSFENKAEKSEVNALSNKVNALASAGLKREIATELPSAENAKENVIYMIGEGDYSSTPTQVTIEQTSCEPGVEIVDNDLFYSSFNNLKVGQYTFEVNPYYDNDGIYSEEWISNVTIPEGSEFVNTKTQLSEYGIRAYDYGSAEYYYVTVTVSPSYASYEEYMYMPTEQRYELIGVTKVDLSNYVPKAQYDADIAALEAKVVYNESLINTYILNIDYNTLLAFDTSELVIGATSTTSVLGQAILGQMVLA